MEGEKKGSAVKKMAITLGLVFVACFAASAAWSLTEHHVMGGKKVKLMPPTPPATPAVKPV